MVKKVTVHFRAPPRRLLWEINACPILNALLHNEESLFPTKNPGLWNKYIENWRLTKNNPKNENTAEKTNKNYLTFIFRLKVKYCEYGPTVVRDVSITTVSRRSWCGSHSGQKSALYSMDLEWFLLRVTCRRGDSTSVHVHRIFTFSGQFWPIIDIVEPVL